MKIAQALHGRCDAIARGRRLAVAGTAIDPASFTDIRHVSGTNGVRFLLASAAILDSIALVVVKRLPKS